MTTLTETDVESAALAWLAGADWQVARGSDIAPGSSGVERDDYVQVVLKHRLGNVLADLNRVRFNVIHELEQRLPAAIYKYEWQLAEEGKGKTYRAVTNIERWIPALFGVMHVVLGIVIILSVCGVVDLLK